MLKNKNKKISLAIYVSLLFLISGHSYADFNIYADPDVVSKKIKKQDKYSFKQIGTSLEKSKVVKNGFAPLNLALDHLVPDGWEIRMTPNIGLEESVVKWKGNVTWPYAIENISINNEMDTVINWERRYVSIDSKSRKENIEMEKLKKIEAEYSIDKKEIDSNSNINLLAKNDNLEKNNDLLLNKIEKNKVDNDLLNKDNNDLLKKDSSALSLVNLDEKGTIEQKLKKMSPKEKFELEKEYNESNVFPLNKNFESFVENKNVEKHEYMQLTFTLKSNMSLQENIRMWANSMNKNWTLQWDAKKDFMITKDIEFKNTFIDVFPEIELLYDKSNDPIEIDLYIKNTTIHVTDKEYKINHREAGI